MPTASGRHGFAEQRIGIDLAHGDRQPLAVGIGNVLPVEGEQPRQPLHQRGRERAVVILELREIGGADRQSPCQFRLAQGMGLPQRA
jgi:hypothetical protein